MAQLIVRLVSGREIIIQHVMLYPRALVAEKLELKAKAAEKLRASGLSVGFFGSPEWVLGGALVTGLLQAVLTKSIQKEAAELLEQAKEKEAEITASGRIFDVANIKNINTPLPSSWISIVREKNKPDPRWGWSLESHEDVPFIHNGSQFVFIKDSNGRTDNIKWDCLESSRFE